MKLCFIFKFCVLNMFSLYCLGWWSLNFSPKRAQSLYSSSLGFLASKILEILLQFRCRWGCGATWGRVPLLSLCSFPCCGPMATWTVPPCPNSPAIAPSYTAQEIHPFFHLQHYCLVEGLITPYLDYCSRLLPNPLFSGCLDSRLFCPVHSGEASHIIAILIFPLSLKILQ